MPHQKTPKLIPNFFPIFFLLYEKRIHVKKMDYNFKNLSIIIIMKKIQYFILIILF
jgi:hypothetical protein